MQCRAGNFAKQAGGYEAFIPKPLPPDPPIKYDDELHMLLSKADRSLARLDGIISVLPNPDLFVAMYVKKEALLSSQIEGTQVSLEGILEFEANIQPKDDINEIKEVFNYVNALNYGIKRLESLPMSLRLIREIHKILLEGVRGASRNPGEFRKRQNFIGPQGCSIHEAAYIPSPPHLVLDNMGNIEKFIHSRDKTPPLIKIALIHAQFETVHPFLDGNGRIGRLLVTFYLFWKEILFKPLLYLSFYQKKNRSEYYERLQKIRTEGAWEGWLKFFLKGVAEISDESAKTAREIIKLKEDLIAKLYEKSISSIYAVKLLDIMYDTPIISVNLVTEKINITKRTAIGLINRFEEVKILKEITGKQRYKRYMFSEYVSIIRRGTEI